MRQGEITGLRWCDTDLDNAVIHVRQVAQTLWKKGIVFAEPKTEKAKRSIKITNTSVELLREHKANQEAIKKEDWPDYDLVFCTNTGKPISGRNLLKYFHRLLEKANLPKMRFHDLRHTMATLLLPSVHPKLVQERLGHSRINTTLDVYSHVLPDIQEQAAEEMDNILSTA